MVIFTVYKPEENLDYLDDWLLHHTNIGVTHFYMYDNGGGNGNWGIQKEKTDINYSKSGFKHRYGVGEAREKQIDIFKKYNVTHKLWQPKDYNGNILYRWNHAVVDFNQNVNTGLCAFIDIDEFIIKNEEFKVSRLNGIQYKAMHYYKSLRDCHERCILQQMDTKCILDLSSLPTFPRMVDDEFDMHFTFLTLPETTNYYNHYNYSKYRHRKFQKYNTDISVFEKTSFNKMFVYENNSRLML